MDEFLCLVALALESEATGLAEDSAVRRAAKYAADGKEAVTAGDVVKLVPGLDNDSAVAVAGLLTGALGERPGEAAK
jgi:hypothetical protein